MYPTDKALWKSLSNTVKQRSGAYLEESSLLVGQDLDCDEEILCNAGLIN